MAAILITGANQGIGYHLTAALLRQGHQVAVLDWETHHLAALQNTFPTQLAYYPVDVRQGEALQAAVAAAQAWQGTPEVVIHNACCCPFGGWRTWTWARSRRPLPPTTTGPSNWCGAWGPPSGPRVGAG